jgi:hypothetical protein
MAHQIGFHKMMGRSSGHFALEAGGRKNAFAKAQRFGRIADISGTRHAIGLCFCQPRRSARKQSRRKRLASERSSQNVLWGHDRNRPLGIQVAPATCGYTKVLRPSMTTVSSFTFPTQAQIIAGAGADGK